MVNLLVCLKIWAGKWANKTVVIFVDNMAVVDICASGYTRDKFLATCTRNIWLFTAIHDIDLQVRHIAGYKNKIADLLSRWEYNVACETKLSELVEHPQWCNVPCDSFDLDTEI